MLYVMTEERIMKKNPDEEEEDKIDGVDREVQEFVEQLPSYQDYRDEQRGDSLNFGDW